MGLKGRAFNAMWSNLLESSARELDRWHTIEHMPERLGVPGFLRGRRYINAVASDHSIFILYEAAHIETFRSPGLIARLNDPTEWSKRVQPGLLNFTRGPCQTLISLGEGVGGAILTVRLSGDARYGAQVGNEITDLAPALTRLHGVTAVHIGRHVPDEIDTAEKKLRPQRHHRPSGSSSLSRGSAPPNLRPRSRMSSRSLPVRPQVRWNWASFA
jgi:hypothetical protein